MTLRRYLLFTFFLFQPTQNITFNHDPGTSDDSGRASERLTTSSVAQRDQDSSRDRLSDVSVTHLYTSFYPHVIIYHNIKKTRKRQSSCFIHNISFFHLLRTSSLFLSDKQASSRCSSGKGYIVSIIIIFIHIDDKHQQLSNIFSFPFLFSFFVAHSSVIARAMMIR